MKIFWLIWGIVKTELSSFNVLHSAIFMVFSVVEMTLMASCDLSVPLMQVQMSLSYLQITHNYRAPAVLHLQKYLIRVDP